MENSLLSGLRREFNWTRTENGAPTYKSTLDDVLDFYSHAAAMRGNVGKVPALFANAYAQDALLALKAAFNLRDVRGGAGERDSFRSVLRWLYDNDRPVFNRIVSLVPEYGRWDDILEFVDSIAVQHLVDDQLYNDVTGTGSVSLLAKWMPSINTSSKASRSLARKWANVLGITQTDYRKILSELRRRINIVERLMSAGNFEAIDYSKVPSNAATLYRKAFSKRDADRYVAYLEDVKAGKSKINAGTLYPYDLVGKYLNGYGIGTYDETVELQWKALPNYANTDENALVVVDVSGSMFDGGKPPAITVSISLGIYVAERNKGAFKNNFITFSDRPQLVTLRGNRLIDKVKEVLNPNVGYSTNIQAVFDMLLSTAVSNNVPEVDMPTKIFIISDMEFNSPNISRRNTNFDAIKRKYNNAGYVMPTLVFWNVSSRNIQSPVTKDENGVYLVAGASPTILKNALNTCAVTPLDLMLEVLNGDRYVAVEEALKG